MSMGLIKILKETGLAMVYFLNVICFVYTVVFFCFVYNMYIMMFLVLDIEIEVYNIYCLCSTVVEEQYSCRRYHFLNYLSLNLPQVYTTWLANE